MSEDENTQPAEPVASSEPTMDAAGGTTPDAMQAAPTDSVVPAAFDTEGIAASDGRKGYRL